MKAPERIYVNYDPFNGEYWYTEPDEHMISVEYIRKDIVDDMLKMKPTWSEEDDVMVRDVLGCLPTKTRPEFNQRRIDWIKSLKGRVQPKQEWSEKDELSLKQAIYVCHQNGYTAVENWLKSLKERLKGE